MNIRNMKISDYESVYALWMSCTGMGLNNLDDSKEGIEIFLKRNPTTCFVAEENGRIIGVIMVGSDGRRGYIYHTRFILNLGDGALREAWSNRHFVNSRNSA